jgi:uncharacterized membrane protein
MPCAAASSVTVFSSRSNSCTSWALKAALYCFLLRMALSLAYPPPSRGPVSWVHYSLLVVTQQPSLREYLEAFVEIGRYATTDARVSGALLDTLSHIATACSAGTAPACFPHLRDVATAVANPAISHAGSDIDRCALMNRLQSLEQTLGSAET